MSIRVKDYLLNNLDFCKIAHKVKYNNIKHARTVLNSIKNRRGKKAANRYYYCESCGGFHLTSLTLEEETEIKNSKEKKIPLIFNNKFEQILKNKNNEKQE